MHPTGDPNAHKTEFVMEAGSNMMRLLQGAYSCITLVKGVSDWTGLGWTANCSCVRRVVLCVSWHATVSPEVSCVL